MYTICSLSKMLATAKVGSDAQSGFPFNSKPWLTVIRLPKVLARWTKREK